MREIRMSGSMSGEGKPPAASRSRSSALPRLYSWRFDKPNPSFRVLETIYRFKQRLCYLLLKKHRTRKQCEQLVQLGQTLVAWSEEIVAMWRFTRNNGITEGFPNKMELISRQAYGFRNFENYRLRVKVLCD